MCARVCETLDARDANWFEETARLRPVLADVTVENKYVVAQLDLESAVASWDNLVLPHPYDHTALVLPKKTGPEQAPLIRLYRP